MIDENMHRTTFGDGREAALDFSFWSVRPEIVRDNVARYVAGTGETICCVEVAGRYEKFVADGFAQGCGPDVFYAQRAEASLWDSQGHIAWLDEADPPLATLLPQMDRRLVEGARNANGRLLGLTHYNGGPFTLFVHERFAAGIDPSALTTWDGVLEQLRRARRDGLAVSPAWR